MEMILLVAPGRDASCALTISPDGLNMGINIGRAAGAGVAGHIHMHVLPRWVADANFMTVGGRNAGAAGGSFGHLREIVAGFSKRSTVAAA